MTVRRRAKRLRPYARVFTTIKNHHRTVGFYGDNELIAFLATSNHLGAIQALAKDLRRRPIELRMGVVSVFGRSDTITSSSGHGH